LTFNPTKQLNEKEVKECVNDIVGYGGELIYTRHASKRMEERGYSYRDIYKILLHGSLVDVEENTAAGNWKYTFAGEDLDGDSGSVIIALVQRQECVVITLLSS
jgi:hypothetical protein